MHMQYLTTGSWSRVYMLTQDTSLSRYLLKRSNETSALTQDNHIQRRIVARCRNQLDISQQFVSSESNINIWGVYNPRPK